MEGVVSTVGTQDVDNAEGGFGGKGETDEDGGQLRHRLTDDERSVAEGRMGRSGKIKQKIYQKMNLPSILLYIH